MRTILALCGILAVFEFEAYAAEAAPGGGERFRAEVRGIGSVEVTLRHLGPGNTASLTTFTTEDAEHAKVLASKRLADLLGFGDIEPVTDVDLSGTVLALDGTGCWLLGLDGERFQELFAPSKEALANLAKDCVADGWQPVPQRAYPRWLDATDNAAMCFWFSGFGVMPKNPDADFRWLAENGFTVVFNPGADEERLVAPGLIDAAALDWQRELARKYDVPFKTMENMVMPIRPSWLWNITPLPYKTTTFMPVAQTDRFMKDYRRRFAGHLAADPNFVGHMVWQEGPGKRTGHPAVPGRGRPYAADSGALARVPARGAPVQPRGGDPAVSRGCRVLPQLGGRAHSYAEGTVRLGSRHLDRSARRLARTRRPRRQGDAAAMVLARDADR